MTDNTRGDIPSRGTGSDTGVALLAAGGLAAAFGVASCCALPTLLGSLGVGSAWLIAVAWLAAPHRAALLAVAVVCLVGSGGLLLRRLRSAARCAPGAACGRRPVVTGLLTVALSLGAVLTVLGFLYA
jgi:mercuric ion transport protein